MRQGCPLAVGSEAEMRRRSRSCLVADPEAETKRCCCRLVAGLEAETRLCCCRLVAGLEAETRLWCHQEAETWSSCHLEVDLKVGSGLSRSLQVDGHEPGTRQRLVGGWKA